MNIKTQKVQPLRHMKSSSTREIYSFKCLQLKRKWLNDSIHKFGKTKPKSSRWQVIIIITDINEIETKKRAKNQSI